jgi:hypothetical protein
MQKLFTASTVDICADTGPQDVSPPHPVRRALNEKARLSSAVRSGRAI